MASKKYVLKVNNTEPDELGNVNLPLNLELSIDVTKAELDTHITDSTLIPGSLYKINGVQPFLYGGTNIWLKALTNNTLDPKGIGEFYVPKYNKTIEGYGIYESLVKVEVTDDSYPPNQITYNSNVTTNNGAVGKWKSVNFIEFVSGDWATATTMVVNGITFTITSVITKTYVVNDTVIWGGKKWKNITGNHGNVIDMFTLNPEDWEIIPFDDINYNIEYDEIGYDYINDCINYRRDVSNNIVEFSYNWWFNFENDWWNADMENSLSNPIKSFQWGNHYDYSSYKGNMSNNITNSLIENINSKGSTHTNTAENNGLIYSNTMENGSTINTNTLNNGKITSNTLNNGTIDTNTLNNANIHINIVNNGSINDNTFNNGHISGNIVNNGQVHTNSIYSGNITYNTLNNGSIYSNDINNGSIGVNTLNNGDIYTNTLNNGQIHTNTLNDGAIIYSNTLNNGQIKLNNVNRSSIYTNMLDNGQISYNTIENSGSISDNTINNGHVRLGLVNPINNKSMKFITINGGDIGGTVGINLSTATLVYMNYTREVFKNSVEITKIKYFNENNELIIADLTD